MLEAGHETRAIELIFDTLATLDLELAVRPRGQWSWTSTSGWVGVSSPGPRAGTGGRKVRITHDDAVADDYGAEIPPLPCSLPTPGPSEPAKARASSKACYPRVGP